MFCIQASRPSAPIAAIEAMIAPRPSRARPEKVAMMSEIAPIAEIASVSQTPVKKIQLRCCQ